MVQIKAAFFDVDGTTLLNEDIHGEATFNVTQNNNIPISKEEFWGLWNANLGRGHGVVYDQLKGYFPDATISKEDFVDQCMDQYEELIAIPGKLRSRDETVEAIMLAQEKGMKVAAVSNALHNIIVKGLEAVGLGDVFERILGVDDLDDPSKKKPNPYPYSTMMMHFGVKPEETVVFEDSYSGAEAGARSGAITIQIVEDPTLPYPNADYYVYDKEDYQAVLKLMREDKLQKRPSDAPRPIIGASKLLACTP